MDIALNDPSMTRGAECGGATVSDRGFGYRVGGHQTAPTLLRLAPGGGGALTL